MLKSGDASTSLAKLRQEIRIVLLNEEGQPVRRYLVHRCWVSEFQALPDLDAGANAIAIEHIKLENEGWERDAAGRDAGDLAVAIAGVLPSSGERVTLREPTGDDELLVLEASGAAAVTMLELAQRLAVFAGRRDRLGRAPRDGSRARSRS